MREAAALERVVDIVREAEIDGARRRRVMRWASQPPDPWGISRQTAQDYDEEVAAHPELVGTRKTRMERLSARPLR